MMKGDSFSTMIGVCHTSKGRLLLLLWSSPIFCLTLFSLFSLDARLVWPFESVKRRGGRGDQSHGGKRILDMSYAFDLIFTVNI
jgi:hypothetical protein